MSGGKGLILVIVLLAMLAIAVVVTLAMWNTMGDVEMSAHGIVALVLGVVLALGLGIGLMALVFYSSRSGHDDEIGR